MNTQIVAMTGEHADAVLAALHQRCGFRRIGVRERIGRHHGRWRDVILLERRSPTLI